MASQTVYVELFSDVCEKPIFSTEIRRVASAIKPCEQSISSLSEDDAKDSAMRAKQIEAWSMT